MKIQLSPYVHLFQRDVRCYLYNAANNFFCEIDTDTYAHLKDNDLRALDRNDVAFLKQKGVLLSPEAAANILLDQKLKYQVHSYQQDVLGLVLVPSAHHGLQLCLPLLLRGAQAQREHERPRGAAAHRVHQGAPQR